MICLKKFRFLFYVFLFFPVQIESQNIPFSIVIDDPEIHLLNEQDRVISGTEDVINYIDFVAGQVTEVYREHFYHYDLGVHVLYNNGAWVAFNEYPVGEGLLYSLESGRRVSAGGNMPGVIIGMSKDSKWVFVFNGFGYGNPWSIFTGRMLHTEAYAPDERPGRLFTLSADELHGDYEPGELSWYLRRLYMIRYMYDTRFVMTVAMDESVDFRPTEIGERDGSRVWYSRTEKNTMLPFPVVNYEVLPSSLWVLDMPDALPPNDEEIGEYTITPIPLDLRDYGIDGELGRDDPFRIQEHLGYSVYLDRIAFAARIMSDNGRAFREYIFLVPEEGGAPEVLVEMAEGYTLEDMLFSPDGRELALQVADEVYIISGFEASR
ncbi:hypothetical protein [Alkalispirochaeta alkalica]|uniref:hypothetical protein n=1 Tax=Alkalispirochaeta alkalica TaxID=46356 RepID=UPI0003776DFA|nr:hypothetical protein [Alkalispirochaeta alkalica]